MRAQEKVVGISPPTPCNRLPPSTRARRFLRSRRAPAIRLTEEDSHHPEHSLMLFPQSIRRDAVGPKSKLQRALVRSAGLLLPVARLRRGGVHREEEQSSSARGLREQRAQKKSSWWWRCNKGFRSLLDANKTMANLEPQKCDQNGMMLMMMLLLLLLCPPISRGSFPFSVVLFCLFAFSLVVFLRGVGKLKL